MTSPSLPDGEMLAKRLEDGHDRLALLEAISNDDLVTVLEAAAFIRSQASTIEALRGALIEAGRAAGGGLADTVSNEFLLHVPREVSGRIEALEAERDALKKPRVLSPTSTTPSVGMFTLTVQADDTWKIPMFAAIDSDGGLNVRSLSESEAIAWQKSKGPEEVFPVNVTVRRARDQQGERE